MAALLLVHGADIVEGGDRISLVRAAHANNCHLCEKKPTEARFVRVVEARALRHTGKLNGAQALVHAAAAAATRDRWAGVRNGDGDGRDDKGGAFASSAASRGPACS
jgi:hypothetical protein